MIEPERPSDRAAVRELLERAFDGERVAGIVDRLREADGYEPDLALVARRNDEVVGFVMIGHATLEDGTARHDVLNLSPLAVAEPHRRQGIGAALVRAVVAAAEERSDLPRLIVLEGSPRYYGRLGFEFAPDHGIRIDLPDWAPAEAAQLHRLSGYDPAVRGRVVYPPAFD